MHYRERGLLAPVGTSSPRSRAFEVTIFVEQTRVDTAQASLPEHKARVAAREKILRLLCQGPLRWSEMQTALGLMTNEARYACEWLMDHSYIAPMKLVRGAARSVDALWTLGDRGRAWAARNGALAGEGGPLRN